jgi:DNA-binding SARP family transcriptional activator/LysM repeat protein
VTRLGHFVKGLGALGLLAALVVGVPWLLWHFIGWPLPHAVPDWGQLRRGLDQHGIPDQVLIKALASVVWLTWVVLITSVAVEIPAALRGRSTRQLRFVGIFQPVTGRLVAAVVVAVLVLAPRPAQSASPGSLGVLSPNGGHRPVAAVMVNPVLADTSWTAPATADPVASTAAPPVSSSPTAAPTQVDAVGSTQTYVVQRGDTLWGIAEHQLGDPLRWSEIFQLNAGRPQPGGRTLADPNWIDPGWTLILPAGAGSITATPVPPSVLAAPTPAPSSTPASAPSAPTPNSSSTNPVPAVSTNGRVQRTATSVGTGANGRTESSSVVTSSANPVRLLSGSVLGASFAAGVLSAVALGRLRRRHAYRYSTPQSGVDLIPDPPRPTLRELVSHYAPPIDGDDAIDVDEPSESENPRSPYLDSDCHLDPGRVDIGVRSGATVTIDVTELSGIALVGSATDDIVRSVIASLLVRAGPGAAEVIVADELSDHLFPHLPPVEAIRRVRGADDVARALEAEMVVRLRRLDAAEADDAAAFRAQNPENPLPLLVALLTDLLGESLGRWTAILEGATRLGIAVLFLGPNPLAKGRLVADLDGIFAVEERADLDLCLSGTEGFTLSGAEAVELLSAVIESQRDGDSEEERADDKKFGQQINVGESEPTPPADRTPAGRPRSPSLVGQHWPQDLLEQDRSPRPIVVQLFGPYGITAHGEAVTTGLRRRAKALLAWYLVNPEGATGDEAVEALWPEIAPDRVHDQFWHAYGDLKTRFRGPGGETLEVLTKTGEHYRPSLVEISCDLWQFQRCLDRAAHADDDQEASTALRGAVGAYAGDLLAGSDFPWIEPVRQDLHRRCLDAHLRLAEIENQSGHSERALSVLEEAIELDRYAEEPYRRIMTLQAACSRPDTVTATWRLLQSRLGDLDLEVEEATSRLYYSLTSNGSRA